MAQTIGCDLCGQETAVMLQTNIDTGEVISIGPSCAFSFYVGAARGMAEGMPAEVKTAHGDIVQVLVEAFYDGGPAVPESWIKAIGGTTSPATDATNGAASEPKALTAHPSPPATARSAKARRQSSG